MVIRTIPGGLWELFIGVWLIAKGFSRSSPVLASPTFQLVSSVVSTAGG